MKVSILLVMLAFVAACKQENDAAKPNEYAARHIRELNTSDTFFYDFGINISRGFDSAAYYELLNFEKKIGLHSLEKGFDSVQIRIGFGCSLDWRDKLVVLTHYRNRWAASLYNIKYYYDDPSKMNRPLMYEVLNIATSSPKSGWIRFVNLLFDTKLLVIKDDYTLPDYWKASSANDGCGIGISVATKNVYRFYSYRNPDLVNGKYWQADSMVRIRELLYEEFPLLKQWDNDAMERLEKYLEEKEAKRNDNNNNGKKVKMQEIYMPDTPRSFKSQ